MCTLFDDLHVLKSAEYITQLSNSTKQLNAFAIRIKMQRADNKTIREIASEYNVDLPEDFSETLFDDSEIVWLES